MLTILSFVLLIPESSSNLLQPEYSIQIFNTENIILSLEDFDVDNSEDLDVLKKGPENPDLEKKLNKFHKYINIIKVSERPLEKFFFKPTTDCFTPEPDIQYPDSPIQIALNKKQLSRLERRSKKNWLKKLKLMRRKWRIRNWRQEKREAIMVRDNEEVEKEYDDLEKQYHDLLEKSQKQNLAFAYSDEGKPEENLKDVINKITDVKTPKNCTNVTGIGIQGIECLIKKYQEKKIDQKSLIKQISLILIIWIGVYLAIALPLWCWKGWCCCCCRCAFCLPQKTVREIETYISRNPPGVHINTDGVEEHYNPNVREIELYEKIRRSIADFKPT